MKVEQIRINGLENPLGTDTGRVSVSWLVTGAGAREPRETLLEAAADEEFHVLLCRRAGAALFSGGEPLTFSLAPRTRYYVRVTVTTADGETAVSPAAFFETGKRDEPFCGVWIAPRPEDSFHPLLQKQFSLPAGVRRGRLYVCGLGLFEARLNGKKLGDDFLAPFFNNYRARLQVCTYELFPEEENLLEIALGKGWYMGRFGPGGGACHFGDRMAALAEVHLETEDGEHLVIPTDESWSYRGSDIADSGIYDGETLDRCLWEGKDNRLRPVCTLPDGGNRQAAHLTDRFSPPLGVREILPVQEILRTPAGETVLDFGQNFAGYAEFDARLPRGCRVTLDYGEILQDGNFYRDNYRTATARFTYVSGGTPETVRPHFTYFGFRYVRLTGFPAVDPADFRGCAVYSRMEPAGTVVTGHKKLNRLLENCRWGMKSNFVDMPTDCPQRDERLGWTGDAQVFAPAACYFMDTRAFFDKYCRELREEQLLLDGGVPNFVPSFGRLAGISGIWGDAATLLPHTLFRQFGDRQRLAEQYPMMRDWVDYVRRENEARGNGRLALAGFQFGDWLALDGITPQSMKGGTDDGFLASLYYFRSAGLTAQAAAELGLSGDAARYGRLREEIREALLHEYFTPSGRLAVDTQTAYLTALRFGVSRDRAVLLGGLRERLRRDRFRIRGGFVGAPVLCQTLAAAGLPQLAYDFLLREDDPSWLACLNRGATTIWERWNSVLPDGRISGTAMNSLNHYAFGAVAEFLFAYAAGLRPEAPGFRRARIEPCPDPRLGFLRCRYRSVSGEYAVSWTIGEDGRVEVDVTVPFGCMATLVLPDGRGEIRHLHAGEHHFLCRPLRDPRLLYRPDTPLDTLAADPRAMAILREKAPAMADFAESGDPELGSVLLDSLPGRFYLPHDPARLAEAIREILRLPAEGVPQP